MQLDKITHTFAGAAIAAAMLPCGVIPALLAVLVTAVGKSFGTLTATARLTTSTRWRRWPVAFL